MEISRRDFLKVTGASAAGAAVLGLGLDLEPLRSRPQTLKIRHARESTSICCYCGVGCGLIVHTERSGGGRIINIEGDPDHPINEGSLCSKGAVLSRLADNENRITAPLYRKPFSTEWQEVSWDWALRTIAERMYEIRRRGI